MGLRTKAIDSAYVRTIGSKFVPGWCGAQVLKFAIEGALRLWSGMPRVIQ
jgi:hypothetical protein